MFEHLPVTFPLIWALGFANAPLLYGLAAASVPIIIHLLNRRKYREVTWAAMRFLLAAIRKASETTPDPRGPIKLDDYGNPTENIYIVKVEKVGGKLQNTVVHTYPMVSQFWTYKADEFLKTPAYDRNYPPVRP